MLSRRKVLWTALGVFLGFGVLLVIYAFWIEPRRLVNRDVTLSLPHWPEFHQPLRVAVLTDLHVGSPHHGLAKLKRIVVEVNERHPDLILILGDVVIQGVQGGKFVPPEQTASQLAGLQSRYGTFAVLGNHDWWLDAERVGRALERNGIVLLEDTAAAISTPAGELWLAGVSDFWEGEHDVTAALRTVPSGAPVIVFTHNPDVFPQVPGRVSLTVAGHTHGGQVRLPLIGAPIVPSRYGQRYVAGHVVEGGRHLFVSTGTGTSILPVRFRVPPELVILQLQSMQADRR